jgi:hypothetical protein
MDKPTKEDNAFGIAAIRALQAWIGTMPDAVPNRAADALYETAQNSIDAIAHANGLEDAMLVVMLVVQEANEEWSDDEDRFWLAVQAELDKQS